MACGATKRCGRGISRRFRSCGSGDGGYAKLSPIRRLTRVVLLRGVREGVGFLRRGSHWYVCNGCLDELVDLITELWERMVARHELN